MINIAGNDIIDIAVGSTPIEKVYLGSQLVWEKIIDYIVFADSTTENICCTRWGTYNEITTVDNGDNTVTITTAKVEMLNTTVKSRTTISTIIRPIEEGDVAGIVKEPIGMTYAQAAAVTTIGTVFQSNKTITSFDELKYFTKVTSLSRNAFNGCSVLRSIGLDNIVTVNKAALAASGLYYAWFPKVTTYDGASSSSNSPLYNAKSLIGVRFDVCHDCSKIAYGSTAKYVVVTSDFVPTVQANGLPAKVYVRTSQISAFQAHSVWGTKTIKDINSLPTDYPNCPWIEDLTDKGFIT